MPNTVFIRLSSQPRISAHPVRRTEEVNKCLASNKRPPHPQPSKTLKWTRRVLVIICLLRYLLFVDWPSHLQTLRGEPWTRQPLESYWPYWHWDRNWLSTTKLKDFAEDRVLSHFLHLKFFSGTSLRFVFIYRFVGKLTYYLLKIMTINNRPASN